MFTNVHTCMRVLMLICCKFKYHFIRKLNQHVLLTHINIQKKKLKYVTDIEGIHTMSFSV